jgi:GAF domain-containing protein
VDAATRSIFVQQKIRGTAVLPLWVSGKQLGIVVIESEDPHHFTESEIRPYTSLAQQMAIAVENRRLFEQTQAALAETELLYNASRRIALATDLQEIAATVAEAVPITEINRAVLFEFEYDSTGQMTTMVARANWYSGKGTFPAEIGMRYPGALFTSLSILNSRDPVFFDDIQHDERVDPNILTVIQRLDIVSLAALPLWVAGRQVGSLLLETEELHRFSESEIRPYTSLAQQMAIAVENRRLFEQTQAALSEAEDLYKASARLNAASTPDETLLAVSQSALSSGMTSAFLFTFGLDEAGHPKEMITVSSLDAQGNPMEAFLGAHFQLSDFSYSKYWLEDPYNPFVIADVAHDERLTDDDRARMVDAGAIVVIPLVLGMRWIGVISVSWGRPHSFGEKELRLYRSLAAQAATVLDNQLLLKQTQKRAERESIINLINQKIQGATSVEAAMQTAARELGQAFKARRAVVELGTAAGPKNGK